jgi:hypothetical protein
MYTYFLVATENKIAQMKSVDDVCKHIEKNEPMLGGKLFTLEAMTNLSKIFLQNEKENPVATDWFVDGSRFYVFDDKLCRKIALIDWDDLLQASVLWSDSEPWKSIEHNQMDLAGSIIDIASLCKQTGEGKSLYILLSNEN